MKHPLHLARLSFSTTALLLCTVASSANGQGSTPPPPDVSTSQSQQDPGSSPTTPYASTGMTHEQRTRVSSRDLWKHPGIGLIVGVNGIGLDIAEPLGQHFNVRAGGEYLKYSGNFTSDGAQINAALRVGGGHVALDYYPWHNGFRISPQVRFAVQTHADVNVLVAAGQQISLDGGDFVSSNANPLHGTGFVNTRKTAPGISIGYGNLSPRHGAHFSFPVEFGFYYIGQPTFDVTFVGTACDPHLAQPIGCQDVASDAGFQTDLARFIKRQNNNLSYASFFPIASAGVGYRF